MKHLKYLTVALLLTGPVFLSGQTWDKMKYGLIGLQYQQVNFDEFNRQIAEAGYAALSESIFEIQGGGAKHSGRWRVGMLLNLVITQDEVMPNGQQTRYEQFAFSYSTSYGLTRPESNWFIGPEVNMNAQWGQVVLSREAEIDGISNAFEADYLKINRFDVPIDLGILVQHAMRSDKDAARALIFGLRLGYRLDDADAWRIDQAVDIGGSGLQAGGWFASVHLGFQ